MRKFPIMLYIYDSIHIPDTYVLDENKSVI